MKKTTTLCSYCKTKEAKNKYCSCKCSNRANARSVEGRLIRSNNMKRFARSVEGRLIRSNNMKMLNKSPEMSIRISHRNKELWSNDEHRKNRTKNIRIATNLPENKEKRRQNTLKQWQNPAFSDKVLKTLRNNYLEGTSSPNKAEKKLLSLLKEIDKNWTFVGNGTKIIANKSPDFVNENKKLIIEFLGTHWHKNETDNDRKSRANLFKDVGYNTLYIWDTAFKRQDELRLKIKEFV
jgi:very-short-patch-repair endonuclease